VINHRDSLPVNLLYHSASFGFFISPHVVHATESFSKVKPIAVIQTSHVLPHWQQASGMGCNYNGNFG
jgi:hypothetical protein